MEKSKKVWLYRMLECQGDCKVKTEHAYGEVSKKGICCFCGEARPWEEEK